MSKFVSPLLIALSAALVPLAVNAAPIAQAAADETDSQSMDPNGFKLMAVCIGLLVLMAFSLIGGVIFYFVKSKKPRS